MAVECNGEPDALGVSRTIAVDPVEHSRVGTMQYAETLPLADHEVVLTFDDGPSPRYTGRILATLATECVKATFFMVGEMAKLFPEEAREVKAEGHTIGTHSFRHPFTFGRMSEAQAGAETDKGIQAVAAALGNPDELAPFFRVPGFLTSKSTEAALASRKLMTWSTDVTADDWKGISSAEIEKRAIDRIEEKGRGILLLHDIHEQTVLALPNILDDLKQRGYRIVQVIPAYAAVAKTERTPDQWRLPEEHSLDSGQTSKQASLSSAVGEDDRGGLACVRPDSKAAAELAPAASDIRAAESKLGTAKGANAVALGVVELHHRCDQQLGCRALGCRRDLTARLNQGDADAYFPKAGDHLVCSAVRRNARRQRFSGKEIRHWRQRRRNQDRQHNAVQRTGILLRNDWKDRSSLL